MASLSLDMTGLMMIGVNYKDSSYAPHARAAELILEEEAEHEMFAVGELRARGRALRRGGSDRGAAQWLPRAVNFFGPPGSGFSYDCLRFGLKSKDNGNWRSLSLDAGEAAGQGRPPDAAADAGISTRAGLKQTPTR